MQKRILAYAWLCLLSFEASPAFGECLRLTPSDFSETFNPESYKRKWLDVDAKLQLRLSELDKGLAKNGEKVQESWHTYLNWTAWAAPFLDAHAHRLEPMKLAFSKFFNSEPGFDHVAIMNARDALENYIDFFDASESLTIEELFVAHQDIIYTLQTLFADQECNFAKIEELVSWLVNLEQSPVLVAKIRSQFKSPTVVMRAEGSYVQKTLSEFKKTKSETQFSSNMIQGARVKGKAIVNGVASASPQTHETARIRIDIRGTVHSPSNVATKGPVQVRTSAMTHWSGYADIYWDGEKFGYTPPTVEAQTRSQIKSVDGPIIIRAIGARKAAASKRAGEIEGASIIKRQISNELSTELRKAMSQIEEQSSDITTLLRKTGMLPIKANSSYSLDSLQVGLLPRSASGIQATPKPSAPVNGQFSVSLHENAIPKLVKRILGGSKWQDVMFAELQKELTGNNTKEYLIGLTNERWSAQWDWKSPIRVAFSPDKVTFVFRFSSITINDKTYPIPYEILANFAINNTTLGLEFSLISEVEVHAIDDDLHLNEVAHEFIVRKFHGLFSDKLYLDGIHFPKGGELENLSNLVLEDVKVEQNWLHFGVTNTKPE